MLISVDKSQILTAHNNTLICRIEEYVIQVRNESSYGETHSVVKMNTVVDWYC